MTDNLTLTGYQDRNRISMQDYEIRQIARERGWHFDQARLAVMMAIFMVGHDRMAVNAHLDRAEAGVRAILKRFTRR